MWGFNRFGGWGGGGCGFDGWGGGFGWRGGCGWRGGWSRGGCGWRGGWSRGCGLGFGVGNPFLFGRCWW